jgi:carbon monoxide dehydrogenase subunit G
MDITEQFVVAQPIESVWPLFQDVPELARCLPGAELTKDNGDGSYEGSVSVKLGPISASFVGKATVEFDHDAETIAIKGRGVDRSGGSQGRVDVGVDLVETDEAHTSVTITAAVQLAGPIAQFGRTGLVNEVSKRLIDEFSDCVHAKLDAASPEEAATVTASEVHGFGLFVTSTWSVLTNWLKKLLGK